MGTKVFQYVWKIDRKRNKIRTVIDRRNIYKKLTRKKKKERNRAREDMRNMILSIHPQQL